MRGLLGALFLAPALSAALVVPDVEIEVTGWSSEVSSKPVNDRAAAMIGVTVPESSDIESPDGHDRNIQFNLEIFRSEEACGFGNVTIDGQALPQTLNGDISSGKGLVSSTSQDVISGSWSFYCIKVNGVPDSQLMKFTINTMDGDAIQDVGFSLLFRQAGQVSIMNIEHDLVLADEVVANPNPEALQPAEDLKFSIEDEVDELDYLWSQLREIKHLIHEKERALAAYHEHRQQTIDIKECDSLKCIIRAMADQARNAAHELYGKMRGEFEDEDDSHHFGKKHKHPKGKNHTCGPPEHGNHTLPPPPWKRPHHRPLPICRYPPPPFHHGPPHGKPPGGPHDHHPPGDRPHPPHHKMLPRPDFDWPGPKHDWRHDGPPPPWEQDPNFDAPPHRHGERPHFDGPDHQGSLDFDGPPDNGARPDQDDKSVGGHRGHEEKPDFDGPPRPHHDDQPPPTPEFDEPLPPPPDFDRPPPHHGEHPPSSPPVDDHHATPPPPFGRPGGPGPHGNGAGKALQIVKFTVAGFLFAFLLLALHRRACTPKRRANRQARQEERHRRRAYRRAAHKHIITRLLNRISGGDGSESDENYEEKRERLLNAEEDVEDGLNTPIFMEENIPVTEHDDEGIIATDTQSQTSGSPSVAISTLSTSTRPLSISETQPLMQEFELEELPAYEDSDGSEMSSVIADGFRYMPGTEYTPSHSPNGSVSDILGPDTKS